MGQRTGCHIRALGTQAHGAAQIGIFIAGLDGAIGIFPLGDERNDGMWAIGLELCAIGIAETGHMAGKFNGGYLHAQADAQIGHLVLAGKAGSLDLAFDAAFAEAAGHQHRVVAGELIHGFGGEGFGVDVVDVDAHMVFHARVAQCLVQRFVAVGQFHVFAHHRDVDIALGVQHFLHQIVPALELGWWRVQAQLVADQRVQPLLVQHAGHTVDGVHVGHGDHTPLRHVGEQADFFALVVGNVAVGPAQQGIGLDADFAQLLHSVLGGLGFQLTGGGNPGHIGQVDKGRLVRPQAVAELAHGFQEGQ